MDLKKCGLFDKARKQNLRKQIEDKSAILADKSRSLAETQARLKDAECRMKAEENAAKAHITQASDAEIDYKINQYRESLITRVSKEADSARASLTITVLDNELIDFTSKALSEVVGLDTLETNQLISGIPKVVIEDATWEYAYTIKMELENYRPKMSDFENVEAYRDFVKMKENGLKTEIQLTSSINEKMTLAFRLADPENNYALASTIINPLEKAGISKIESEEIYNYAKESHKYVQYPVKLSLEEAGEFIAQTYSSVSKCEDIVPILI